MPPFSPLFLRRLVVFELVALDKREKPPRVLLRPQRVTTHRIAPIQYSNIKSASIAIIMNCVLVDQ
jgi:hypothetical protein